MRSALRSFPLPSVLYCTAHLCSLHISISPPSLSLPASLSHYVLSSLLGIATLDFVVWRKALSSGSFCARAEPTSATCRRGIRCSWCTGFDLPLDSLDLWALERRGGQGRGEKSEGISCLEKSRLQGGGSGG